MAFGAKRQRVDRRGSEARHDLVRFGRKKIRPLVGSLGTVPFGLVFTLCKICKIRQVVFTTFLNWLLKTSLKKNLHRGAKLDIKSRKFAE